MNEAIDLKPRGESMTLAREMYDLTHDEIHELMVSDNMCLVIEDGCAFLQSRAPENTRIMVSHSAALVTAESLEIVPDGAMVNMSSGGRKFYGVKQ